MVMVLQEVGQLMTTGKASVVGVADLNKNQLEQLYDWAPVRSTVNTSAAMM